MEPHFQSRPARVSFKLFSMHTFIRILDIFFSAIGLILFSPLIGLLTIIGLFDTGSPFFLQYRLGKHKRPFRVLKFRTMKVGTASVGTHEVDPAQITRVGSFLRASKLDELPQLWNVLKGDMSLVGPRPNLPVQHELIAEREGLDVYRARPGITGLAQVSKTDMSTPLLLARVDDKMLRTMSVGAYFKYIFMTLMSLSRSMASDRNVKEAKQGEHPNHPLPKTHQSH